MIGTDKAWLDQYIESGHKPILFYIRCQDVLDFRGKLKEYSEAYYDVAYWPKIVLGQYEYKGIKVVIILEVNRI